MIGVSTSYSIIYIQYRFAVVSADIDVIVVGIVIATDNVIVFVIVFVIMSATTINIVTKRISSSS